MRKTIALIGTLAMLIAACGSVDALGAGDESTSLGALAAPQSGLPLDEGPPPATDPADEALAYAIVDTGQTTCYDDTGVIECPDEGETFFGQDASYTGNTAQYVDNGDGTVTDLVTGLMWQQDPGDKMTYAEAVAAVDDFELAGYSDWRLPTIKELYSLIDFSGTDPSGCETQSSCEAIPFIDTGFFDFEFGDTSAGERMIDSQWATSTIYESTTMGGNPTMFGVNFADGRIKGYPISDPQGGEKEFYVIHVRGATDYGENDFVDNGDGTVTDVATGLTWQQDDSGAGMDWSEALDYCEALELGGSDDWRLPSAKELQSIVDYTRSPGTDGTAAIDPVFTTTAVEVEDGTSGFGFYWTGTTHATVRGGESAVYVSFGEALGWMQAPSGEYTLLDVHGAGAQRSDPKTGDASGYPYGHGPQGDVVRIDNLVRCVTGGGVGAAVGDQAQSEQGGPDGGPLAEAAAILGVSEQALAEALGDPSQGPPDFEQAATLLGVDVEELMGALGAPPGR